MAFYPLLQASLTGVDFLSTSDQAHHNTPGLMTIHNRHQELRFGQVKVDKPFFAHEPRSLFLVPSSLGFVEYNHAFLRGSRGADVFIAKVMNVLNKCTPVTKGVFLTKVVNS